MTKNIQKTNLIYILHNQHFSTKISFELLPRNINVYFEQNADALNEWKRVNTLVLNFKKRYPRKSKCSPFAHVKRYDEMQQLHHHHYLSRGSSICLTSYLAFIINIYNFQDSEALLLSKEDLENMIDCFAPHLMFNDELRIELINSFKAYIADIHATNTTKSLISIKFNMFYDSLYMFKPSIHIIQIAKSQSMPCPSNTLSADSGKSTVPVLQNRSINTNKSAFDYLVSEANKAYDFQNNKRKISSHQVEEEGAKECSLKKTRVFQNQFFSLSMQSNSFPLDDNHVENPLRVSL